MSWREINTQEDIDVFERETNCMHDSVIISVNYVSGCENTERGQIIFNPENRLAVTLDSQWTDRIELLFTGVKYFSVEQHEIALSGEPAVFKYSNNLKGKGQKAWGRLLK